MVKVNTSNIKLFLKQSGVRQKDIASSLGVSPQFVNQVINRKRFTITVRKAIATALNKTVSELWPD